jgi:hypothetical protein
MQRRLRQKSTTKQETLSPLGLSLQTDESAHYAQRQRTALDTEMLTREKGR